MSDKEQLFKTGGCLCSIFWLLLIILLPMSFSTLDYHSMGFVHRRTTGTVDRTKVYTTGHYMLGPDYGFTIFPASVQNVDVTDVSAWTESDSSVDGTTANAGTSVTMDVSYQYQLIPEELSQLFEKRNTVFRPFIENLAMAAIKDTATNFSADAFLRDRQKIEETMVSEIDKVLKQAHTTIRGFQMRRVTFPPTYTNRKLDAATQVLKNGAEGYRKQAAMKRQDATTQVKLVENQASFVKSDAQASSRFHTDQAKVQADDLKERTRSDGLKMVREALENTKGTCRETATGAGSAAADKTTCEASAMQDNKAGCEGAKKAADANAAACTYSPVKMSQKEVVSLDYLINLADASGSTKMFVDFNTVLANGN